MRLSSPWRSWIRPCEFSSAVAAGLVCVSAARGQDTFRGLGDLPGGLGSHATAVSADGSTVVGFNYYVAPGGLLQNQALRWTQAGGLHALFEGGPDYTSAAFAISADGLTIGGWHALTIIEERAFVWSAAAGEHQLATRSGVEALSADGTVAAGYLGHGSGSVGQAAIWDASGHATFIYLPNMVDFASRARGISGDGSTVVGWAPFNGTMVRAFRWTAATGMVNIGSPDPLGPASDAHAITPDGSVIVGAAQPAPGAPNQAAMWTGSSGTQLLGSLSPTADTIAYAVSADGRTIVGASGTRAFIWRQGRGMEDLQSVLGSAAGWTLTDALGISADGTIVVGSGYPPTGNAQAWTARIPSCYANCDGSTTTPVLNVLDFSCFLNRFAAADSYANCDGSTTPPVLNVLDFSCFLNRFAAGCT